MKRFESCHPICLMLFYVCVLVLTMFNAHPVITGLSFVLSVVFFAFCVGIGKAMTSLLWGIPLIIVMALTNPIFVHKGDTILFFLNDNPVTKEAICYGINASFTLAAVYYWFSSYNEVMTSDKFIYLFGRIAPKLSLMLSMTLNFVPMFKRNYKEIDSAQKTLGIYSGEGYTEKIKRKFRVISALITMSLENGVQTADSMKARGYGLSGRTSYSNFRWRSRDTVLMICLVIFGGVVILGECLGGGSYVFYPVMTPIELSLSGIILFCGCLSFMFVPSAMEIKENMLWRYLKSRI